MNRNKIALDTSDGKKIRVVWYEESYLEHLRRHPDIKPCLNKLDKALKKPELKDIDRKRKSTNYYIFIRKDKNGNNLYLKVIVDYTENPAFVRSAHLTTDTSGANIVL